MAPKVEKNKEKVKAKVIEDKTFGMKNKSKSKAVQNFVKQLNNSMAGSAKQQRLAAQTEPNAKDKKKAEEQKQKELNELFAVAIKQPKVPAGVDPKSVVCEFYRHGQCTKGFKCKFSHDLNVERKGAKIDLFTDQRDVQKEGEGGMDDWDQETLEKVVKEKHGNEKPTNATTIICKHFLDAVERKLYGWFWKCPNGGDCKYRHALPPGYVLKSQMKELLEEEARNQKDAAEMIEEERAKVDAKTPINEVTFREWHRQKMEAKHKKVQEGEEERRKKGILTGREIFMQEGFTVEDDANADDDYVREGREEEEKAIQAMLEKARADAQAARERAAAEPAEAEGSQDAGASGSQAADQGAGAGPSTTLQLDDAEAEELFADDDDDDLDDDELAELEEGIRGANIGDSEDG
mmetsp:Transcript_13640/g.29256  ORF Transcript_13640/g.29256 Transcript_13640/m.29256 type:complete len:407 (-) Transcript_13640:1216-2436(-)|eukprot:CAMPEP_0202918886 /NCGR_PEP_ID=MMETSP1392-20130828/74456_1 /ASSEMBLY_ACC=CAM_ASM_000868 /TAXON_ID=225041 /ORGANISM="Chlamydomonas chlamydogama, Strain SAG 11-48b" /LENGTH=406 /DNA_ID=CAMNT_0049612059 /DNA_START=19 /DNA_END=1239 /DNA_ORIENTATION=+